MCKGQRSSSGVSVALHHVFEERSLAEPGTHRLLDLMARDPPGYLGFLNWDYRSSRTYLTSYMSVDDLNTNALFL